MVPAAAWLAVAALHVAIRYAFSGEGHSLFGVWVRIDGHSYLAIASNGYSYQPTDPYPLVAWFPLYPLAIRLVTQVVHEPVLAAVLVSAVCGLCAAVFFWNWCRQMGLTTRHCLGALAVALVYPYGWFLFGVIYSDAMFVLLSLLAFWLVEKERPVLAFVAVGIATAARPTGVALAVGVVVLVLERTGVIRVDGTVESLRRFRLPMTVDPTRLRPKLLAAPLTLAGVTLYSAYLGSRWGEPLLWLRVQENWSQGPSAGPRSWFKINFLAILIKGHDPAFIATAVPQALLILAGLVAVPSVARRFGWGYGSYVAVTLFMILFGTNELRTAGRYMVGLFPLAALAGIYVSSRPRVAAVWLGVSSVALVVHMVLFARGAYLT